jgi:hypothetical protein
MCGIFSASWSVSCSLECTHAHAGNASCTVPYRPTAQLRPCMLQGYAERRAFSCAKHQRGSLNESLERGGLGSRMPACRICGRHQAPRQATLQSRSTKIPLSLAGCGQQPIDSRSCLCHSESPSKSNSFRSSQPWPRSVPECGRHLRYARRWCLFSKSFSPVDALRAKPKAPPRG